MSRIMARSKVEFKNVRSRFNTDLQMISELKVCGFEFVCSFEVMYIVE